MPKTTKHTSVARRRLGSRPPTERSGERRDASDGFPPPFTGFRPTALTFLRGLARHNEKAWFEAHRDTYETEVKRPLQLLVEEVDARLGVVAPEIVGDPKRSVFRIHRDVRFSADKSPYKTNAACWFYHRDVGHGVGQRTHGGAGFYFQIAPRESFVAAGIWMPPTPVLAQLRQAVAEDYETLGTIVGATAFRKMFRALSEEGMLTRPPRGYGAEHPAGKLLRYRSFMVSRDLTEDELLSVRLPDVAAQYYAVALPLVRWLNGVLGYRATTRR